MVHNPEIAHTDDNQSAPEQEELDQAAQQKAQETHQVIAATKAEVKEIQPPRYEFPGEKLPQWWDIVAEDKNQTFAIYPSKDPDARSVDFVEMQEFDWTEKVIHQEDGIHIEYQYQKDTNTLIIDIKHLYQIDPSAQKPWYQFQDKHLWDAKIRIKSLDLRTVDARSRKPKPADMILEIQSDIFKTPTSFYIGLDPLSLEPWQKKSVYQKFIDPTLGEYKITIERKWDGSYSIAEIKFSWQQYHSDDIVKDKDLKETEVKTTPWKEFSIIIDGKKISMDPWDPFIQDQLNIHGFAIGEETFTVHGIEYVLYLSANTDKKYQESGDRYELKIVPRGYLSLQLDDQYHGGLNKRTTSILYDPAKNLLTIGQLAGTKRQPDGSYLPIIKNSYKTFLPRNPSEAFYAYIPKQNKKVLVEMKIETDASQQSKLQILREIPSNITGIDPYITVGPGIAKSIYFQGEPNMDTFLKDGKCNFTTQETLQDKSKAAIGDFTVQLTKAQLDQISTPNAQLSFKYPLADGTYFDVTINHRADGEDIWLLEFAFNRAGDVKLERDPTLAEQQKSIEAMMPLQLGDIEINGYQKQLHIASEAELNDGQKKVVDRCSVDKESGDEFDIEYDMQTPWIDINPLDKDLMSCFLNKAQKNWDYWILEVKSDMRSTKYDGLRWDTDKPRTFRIDAVPYKDGYGRDRGHYLKWSVVDMPDVKPWVDGANPRIDDTKKKAQDAIDDATETIKDILGWDDPDSDPEVKSRDDYVELNFLDHKPMLIDSDGKNIEMTGYVKTLLDFDGKVYDDLYIDDDWLSGKNFRIIQDKGIDRILCEILMNGRKEWEEFVVEGTTSWQNRTVKYSVDKNGIVQFFVKAPDNSFSTTEVGEGMPDTARMEHFKTLWIESPLPDWKQFPTVSSNIKNGKLKPGWGQWFGWRIHPKTQMLKIHTGIDISWSAFWDAPCQSVLWGKVIFAWIKGWYGNMVIIDHGNGLVTKYAHLADIKVQQWATVTKDTPLWKVGATGTATGPHLHLETIWHGKAINPKEIFVAHKDVFDKIPNTSLEPMRKKAIPKKSPDSSNTPAALEIKKWYQLVAKDIEAWYNAYSQCETVNKLNFSLNDIKAIAFVESGFNPNYNDGLYQFSDIVPAMKQNPGKFPPLTPDEAKNFNLEAAKKNTAFFTKAVLGVLYYKSQAWGHDVSSLIASESNDDLIKKIKWHLKSKLDPTYLSGHNDDKLRAFVNILKDKQANTKWLVKADTLAAYNTSPDKLPYALSVLYAGYCGFAM